MVISPSHRLYCVYIELFVVNSRLNSNDFTVEIYRLNGFPFINRSLNMELL